jgi:HD-GYP domain-containing protein (c-di-GMP phosphodiesterase class II)
MGHVRLAELVGTLSMATDAGVGMPDHHALRGATIAVRLAELMGADERTVRDAFYLPLLAMSGCTAESHTAAEALGDEVAIGVETYGLDFGRASEMLPAVLRLARRGRSPIGGIVSMVRTMGKLTQMAEVGRAHCEVAIHLAERFGFDEPFRAALYQAFERWDGSGKPTAVKGEAISYGMRIAHVAIDANIGHRLGGVEGAVALTRKHAKRGLDPAIVERFTKVAGDVCRPLDDPSPWNVAMASELGPHRTVSGEAIDEALRAIAHVTDLKCRFTRSHSTGVAALAGAAARKLGLGAETEQALARAGLVHDVGRVAVTAAIWDKPGPLTDTERESIRLHTYVGERVLSRAPSLSAVAEIATLAHERLDGSGYHRRLPAAACSPAARVLAAADVYQALREARPHRAAVGADQAAHELSAMVRNGLLCPDAVGAVLAAAGHASRPPERPSGLTDREVEVLRLVARGLTNKEIANTLDISVKTAGHHVQHVLEKLGVTTRAAATMVAMKTGLTHA